MDPFITVVMPVRNEGRFIRDTLEMLLRQDYPPDRFEIIVADGQSDDDTPAIVQETARSHPQVRLVDNPKRRSSAGRNLGFQLGRGDLFLVVDGHCHIDNDRLLRSVADCFARSGADCLGRPQPLDPPGLTPFQESVALARASWIGHSRQSLIYARYEGFASPVSNGAAFRREVFAKVGYVDERMDACEDVEFNYRLQKAGLVGYTSPSLTVRYYPRENLYALYRQMHRYGLGRYRFLQRHPEAFHWESLVPPFFVLGLFFLLAGTLGLILWRLAGLTPFAESLPSSGELIFIGVFAFCYGFYFFYICLIWGASTLIASRHGWGHLKDLPWIFFTIHLGLGCGFLAGLWEIPRPADYPSSAPSPRQSAPLRVDDGKVPR